MSSYTANIPQPGDNPSDSQDQLLQNFQTLNTIYGSSGDHYPWTNTTPTEGNKHAKVTLPGLPTANAPGNAIPNPSSGNCTVFSQTRNSQTTPFVTRDGLVPAAPLTNIWPLMPIKAYAQLSVTALNVVTINDSYNITSCVASSAGKTLSFTLTNAMRTTNFGIIANCTGPVGIACNPTPNTTTTFTVQIGGEGLSAFTGTVYVIVLES